MEVYSDEAVSGARLDRDGMQRLLNDARNRSFRTVLLDDLSRLSRDLGDTMKLVYCDLQAANVNVIDCTTGVASDGSGARMFFGFTAVVNDTFLQMVKAETHRGLEGRALAGYHTGGRCYGYRSEKEKNPQDPQHPRSILVVNPDEAAVVRRVFEQYAAGMDLTTIAATLNAEGIPAPYDKLGYGKLATGKGWAKNQITSMLGNERYIGKVVWNQRQYLRHPITKKRRATKRPDSEWTRHDAPELAIIDADLWERVQAKRTKKRGKRGRPPGQSTMRAKYPHLLTGLLKCGGCGGSMSVVGSKQKGEVKHYALGCSTHHNKGPAACPNKMTISERRVNGTVLYGLIEYVGSDDFRAWVEEGSQAQQEARERARKEETEVTVIRRQEATCERLLHAVAQDGYSNLLPGRLRQEEDKLRGLRQRLAAMVTAKQPRPRVEANIADVLRLVREVENFAAKRPLEAREALHRLLDRIVLTPRTMGSRMEYEAEVVLRNSLAAQEGGQVSDKYGCGGAMINFLSTADAAMIVPIRGRIHRNAVFRGLRGALLSA